EQVLQMRVAVVLPATVVSVVARIRKQRLGHRAVGRLPARRRDLVQPLERVGLQPGLVVVDPHARGDVHRAYERHALGDGRVPDRVRDVLGDPDELAALWRVEGPVDRMGLQAGEPGFEPGFAILETARVTVDSLPWVVAMVPT